MQEREVEEVVKEKRRELRDGGVETDRRKKLHCIHQPVLDF